MPDTHLNNHHRDTLTALFAHPTSGNIRWVDVVSLIGALGDIEEKHDGRFRVTIGGEMGTQPATTTDATGGTPVPRGAEAFEGLRVGMRQPDAAAAVGQPSQKLASERNEVWVFRSEGRTWKVMFDKATGRLVRVVEALPGNAEMIVVQ